MVRNDQKETHNARYLMCQDDWSRRTGRSDTAALVTGDRLKGKQALGFERGLGARVAACDLSDQALSLGSPRKFLVYR